MHRMLTADVRLFLVVKYVALSVAC